ncbi:uncharacterized protein RCC_06047 [Ramularia collo-cygni]|uniref:J domain-containing protein n=1 Tax=Ramularia collo-cygni TaxID=112498 RepID=A0A2D3V413_9PEZI|nr:uncharacterized protein RCC_06047 [Ramularia collo-cygni]CZT20190.1 uncharacterized protein RCC_06047 [Ramularia collo-cygni]
MLSEPALRRALSDTDALRHTEMRGFKLQRTRTVDILPTSLRSEGMPIPVSAAQHPIPEEDLEAASATMGLEEVTTVPLSGRVRRESADLEALERKSKVHTRRISEDCSSSEDERSNWPLLYQMIDVPPDTEPSQFPEKARRSLIKLSLKHGPPALEEHPEVEERWAVITGAYDALSHPGRRKLYDMQSSLT